MSNAPRPGRSARAPAPVPAWLEFLGIVLLAGLAIFFFATSWRKWCDSLVDFGNGLYAAWRLAHGAVLYRDVYIGYGPLSQYFSGALFALFGPGLMVVVAANLAVFVAISSLLYILCRRAWGVVPAFAASTVFIVVFAFSQFVNIGNYNYATPYSQETTHGVLACLILVIVLARWVEDPTVVLSLLAGGLLGVTALLKPEIMFAAASTTLTTALVRWRHLGLPSTRVVVAWALGTAIPTAAFTLYFARFFDWGPALAAACRAWLDIRGLGTDMAQTSFLGLDQPSEHLRQHAAATLVACFLIGAIAGIGWVADRLSRRWQLPVAAGLLSIAVAAPSVALVPWLQAGRCLLGLMLIYLSICAVGIVRQLTNETRRLQTLRLLLCVLATALLSRMVLNGRIYQYGYYQAALAALLVPAIVIGELPSWLRLQARGRWIVTVGCAALMIPGLVFLASRSQALLGARVMPVGEGRDLIYTLPPEVEPRGAIVDDVITELRKRSATGTLLVVPDGAMINYLARLPSPIAPITFHSWFTENGRELQLVAELDRHPPDWIVLISRDLREYGIQRYGERPGRGEEILSWINREYERVWSVGGDPLDYRQRGGVIFRRKTARD
jgi:hypothetical protein